MSRTASSLLSLLAIIGFIIAVPAAAGAADACSVTASPRQGEPGTRFVIKGNGFTPSTVTLTRGDEDPRVIPVDGDDSFKVALVAAEADAGRWRVEADGCEQTTSIRVTLPPTATETTVVAEPDRTQELAAALLLGVLFLGSAALLLPRMTRAARSR